MCQTPRFWETFCTAIGRPDLPEDDRFAGVEGRLENRDALQDEIESALRGHPTAHWLDLLAGKMPIAPVYDIAAALDNPFAEAVGMVNTVDHPRQARGVRMLSSPIKVNGERGPNRRAPFLGEHDDKLP